jgi:hypothetical protein
LTNFLDKRKFICYDAIMKLKEVFYEKV